MTTIEDRLRDYYAARARAVEPDTIGSGVRLPRARSRPRMQAFAPVAAAAAVIAISITAVVIGSSLHTGRSADVSTGAMPSPGQQSVAQLVAADVIPPRFITITATGDPHLLPSSAVVRSTATGAVLATIRPSLPHGTIVAVTGAADDRTFVLAEETLPRPRRDSLSIKHGSLFLLRLRANGTPQALTRLPFTADDGVNGLALSADGAKLAMTARPTATVNLNEIRVYTLATGAVRTWSATGTGIVGDGFGGEQDAAAISWAADGRHLMFNWDDGMTTAERLLDTSLGGASLLADSRQLLTIPTPANRPIPCQGDMVITPDASAVICPGVTVHSESDTVFFREYSTVTGKVVSQLGDWTYHDDRFLLGALWTNKSGSVIIGVIPKPSQGTIKAGPSPYPTVTLSPSPGDSPVIGVIIGQTFTPLNVSGVTSGVW